jgi:hypothetical protein
MITVDAHAHLGDSVVSKLRIKMDDLLGADGLLIIPVELIKSEVLELPEQDLAWCNFQTAINVLGLHFD